MQVSFLDEPLVETEEATEREKAAVFSFLQFSSMAVMIFLLSQLQIQSFNK